MNETKKILLVGVVALLIGVMVGGEMDFDRKEGKGRQMMHKMPNGEMMQNSMENMMHDMNAGLRGKAGDDFDKAFLSEMTVHHEGAVDMAKLVLSTSKRPELIKLANDIISAQTKEIDMMSVWASSWFDIPLGGTSDTKEDVVMCTMDAKACPDGSYVGRKGPKCEFEACPGK